MRTLQGTVVSLKADKTVSVIVVRRWLHPLYKKAVSRSKKYACHYEGSDLAVGDKVEITESKPLSKTKHFIVTKKLAEKSVRKLSPEQIAQAEKPAKAMAKKPKVKKTIKKDSEKTAEESEAVKTGEKKTVKAEVKTITKKTVKKPKTKDIQKKKVAKKADKPKVKKVVKKVAKKSSKK